MNLHVVSLLLVSATLLTEPPPPPSSSAQLLSSLGPVLQLTLSAYDQPDTNNQQRQLIFISWQQWKQFHELHLDNASCPFTVGIVNMLAQTDLVSLCMKKPLDQSLRNAGVSRKSRTVMRKPIIRQDNRHHWKEQFYKQNSDDNCNYRENIFCHAIDWILLQTLSKCSVNIFCSVFTLTF